MVFGKPAPPKPKANDLLPTKLANDIAESLKRILLSDDLEPLEVCSIEFSVMIKARQRNHFTPSSLFLSVIETKTVSRNH